MLVTQDPKRSFTTTLADGRVGWKAVIRSAAGLTPVHTKRHGVPAALQRAPRRSDRNQPADFDDVVARKSEEIGGNSQVAVVDSKHNVLSQTLFLSPGGVVTLTVSPAQEVEVFCDGGSDPHGCKVDVSF